MEIDLIQRIEKDISDYRIDIKSITEAVIKLEMHSQNQSKLIEGMRRDSRGDREDLMTQVGSLNDDISKLKKDLDSVKTKQWKLLLILATFSAFAVASIDKALNTMPKILGLIM